MRKLLTIYWCLLVCCNTISWSQNLSGEWNGVLFTEENQDTFQYQLSIQQNEDQITGTSSSSLLSTKSGAAFTITGVANSERIIIQEINQTSPASPKWCLKYLTLSLSVENGRAKLSGDWKANNCIPGKVVLYSTDLDAIQFIEETITKEEPFAITGKWTGFLKQSDRGYGFYFEVNLSEENSESYIVSEGNGGSAFHQLTWSYDTVQQLLVLKEDFVKNKSDDRWPWCIKNMKLQLSKNRHKHSLEGNWNGFIEGFTPQTGPCAPGQVYLEKPILTETKSITRQLTSKKLSYEKEKARKVKVQRVIEVKNPNLRIKVWDNGTVDGDIVTIFLNGKLLFEDYRVTKHKYTKVITLNQDDNYLILHAEDLGEISPNTVAVSIDDGVKEQIIILSSNLDESGAIMIKQFKLQ